MTIETMLRDEVKKELEELKSVELGSQKYKDAVEGISELTDKAIKLDSVAFEQDVKLQELELEAKHKLEEMKIERRDRWLKHGIAIGSILLTTGVTLWGTLASFEFEKEGSITTIMGRGFINKLLPRK